MKLSFFVFFFIFLTAYETPACSCGYMPTHAKDFKNSNNVFVGEVVSTNVGLPFPEKLEGMTALDAMKFKVEKRWKGAKTSEVTAWLVGYAGACSPIPKLGEKYLIYTRKYKGLTVFNTFCSRTRRLETANEDLLKEYKELDSSWFRFCSNFAYFDF